MNKKKKSPTSGEARLEKKGELLIDSAKIIAQSNNPVKLITAQIRYRMLTEKMYRENQRRK